MKKIMVMLLLLSSICYGAVAGYQKSVDNFEKNRDLKTPEWWSFDQVVPKVSNVAFRNGDAVGASCGKLYLDLKGTANNWYCGGVGTYLGVDASSYTGIELCILGYGEESGTLKIELYDDDKCGWETRYDKTWVALKDDVWYFEQRVDWIGWRKISIPFDSFRLSNPGRGDGKTNFDQENGSGGLLQAQFILSACTPNGESHIGIDNIKLKVGIETQ